MAVAHYATLFRGFFRKVIASMPLQAWMDGAAALPGLPVLSDAVCRCAQHAALQVTVWVCTHKLCVPPASPPPPPSPLAPPSVGIKLPRYHPNAVLTSTSAAFASRPPPSPPLLQLPCFHHPPAFPLLYPIPFLASSVVAVVHLWRRLPSPSPPRPLIPPSAAALTSPHGGGCLIHPCFVQCTPLAVRVA